MTEPTPNQVVAWNMSYFRKAAGLTQQELGEKLGGWSTASVSAAERSWDGKRVKKFDADEITAVAGALGVPVAALFIPPPGAQAGPGLPFLPADPESPVSAAYRQRLAEAGLSGAGADGAVAEEASRQAGALREYRDQWRGELVGMLERLTESARTL